MRGAVIFGCLVSINARRRRNQYPQTENARVRGGISREDQDSNDAVKRHVGSHAAALLTRVRLIQERGSVLYIRVASESEGDKDQPYRAGHAKTCKIDPELTLL